MAMFELHDHDGRPLALADWSKSASAHWHRAGPRPLLEMHSCSRAPPWLAHQMKEGHERGDHCPVVKSRRVGPPQAPRGRPGAGGTDV